jgi:hypothetical protein
MCAYEQEKKERENPYLNKSSLSMWRFLCLSDFKFMMVHLSELEKRWKSKKVMKVFHGQTEIILKAFKMGVCRKAFFTKGRKGLGK